MKILKQTYLVTPLSIGCVHEVVFGGKNCILIAFSPETPCISNLRWSSCNHYSKSVPSIHAFFWDRCLQERLLTCLKHLELADFPITNIGIFSPRAVDAAIPVNRTLLCFPPEQHLPRKCKDFEGLRRTDQIYLH